MVGFHPVGRVGERLPHQNTQLPLPPLPKRKEKEREKERERGTGESVYAFGAMIYLILEYQR